MLWTDAEIQEMQEERRSKWKGYGKAKINIEVNSHAYDHHLTHPINVLLRDYNEFVRLVFKQL